MKSAVLALTLLALPVLAAQGMAVDVQAVAEGKAEPGKEYTIKLHFTVPEGYHAYHKDNPGYSLPVNVTWTDLAGLELVDALWPEPSKHKYGDTEEWELGPIFDIAYKFKVPASAKGKLTVTGNHETQYCDADACYMANGDFSATIEVAEVAPIPVPGLGKKGNPVVIATAAFEGEAKAGAQAKLKLTFEFTQGYHAYHKDNPGYGIPAKVTWTELAGLVLKDTLWPEPSKHDYDGMEEWEYSSPLTLTYTFDVPASAKGELSIAGKWEVQVCDEEACFDRKGEVSAKLSVSGASVEPIEVAEGATDSHGFYLDFNYAVKQSMELKKPLLVDFNGER